MSRQNELNSYIARLQHRLRLGAWLRGAAIFTGTALIVTLALVLLLNHYAFPTHGVAGARLVLLAVLATVAGFGIALPLVRLTRARAVGEVETAHPELEQRLTTFHEREREGGDPFLELLAADTLSRTQDAAPSSLVPDNRLFALSGAGLACLGVLVWMVAAGPGYLGYGASLLWTGPKKNVAPLYAIAVTPGDVAVRRNSDQLITAHVMGMRPEKVQIFAHYQSAGAMGAGHNANAAGLRWGGFVSVCLCRAARERRVLRDRWSAGFAALQGARRGPSFREGNSRDLPVSKMDRDEVR